MAENKVLCLTNLIYTKIDEYSLLNQSDNKHVAQLSLEIADIVIQIIKAIRSPDYSLYQINKNTLIDFYKSESYIKLIHYQQKVNKIYSKHIANVLDVESIDDFRTIISKFTTKNDLLNQDNLQQRLYQLLHSKISLNIENHIQFINKFLWNKFIEGDPKLLDFFVLDASQPWILYWMLHSLDLLGQKIPKKLLQMTSDAVDSFWDEKGGYGGGSGQIGNVITTYACICLQYIAGLQGLNLRRREIYLFLLNMKLKNGSFKVHENGEYDTRSTFCAIAIAFLLNILTEELINGVDKYVSECQSYDGGIAGQPDLESHAAYTFCGLATLCILNKHQVIDLAKLKKWCVNRAMKTEFGFQGRPNKLVDSCYSFWLGASIFLLNNLKIISDTECKQILSWSKLYLLLIGQTESGFMDKPGKEPDLYHTCYSLSSLALTDNTLGFACNLSPINPLVILTQSTVDRGKQVLEGIKVYK